MKTADHTTVRYTVLGETGTGHQPTVALLSGFLCPDTWWHYLAPALVEAGYRVVLLHYRGIATSETPRVLDEETISIERFAQDVLDVLHDAGIDEVALVGHSMGGQVMVEVADRIGSRVWAMVGVTATDRSPTTNLYGQGWLVSPAAGAAIAALRLLREPVGTAVWRTVWTAVPFLPTTRAVRAFGPLTPDEVLRSYIDHLRTLPGEYAVKVLHAMHRHHPHKERIRELDVPTLLIGAEHDPFTPLSTAKRTAHLLPRATLTVVPGTTHAAIVEAPTEVNRSVLSHLGEHAPTAAVPSAHTRA